MAEPRMRVELYCQTTQQRIAWAYVPANHSVCLTGVIDLPVGHHVICLRMIGLEQVEVEAPTHADFSGAGVQAILGQVVPERGCLTEQPT